jgi:hypothetical protein
MRQSLDLYLIAVRNQRYILFSPLDVVAEFQAESEDRIGKFIAWFTEHRYRVLAWLGGVFAKGHEYYIKLENRIDPGERVLKAMAVTPQFVVYHGRTADSVNAAARFRSVLKRQRVKQWFWLVIDFVISAVAIVFTPFLAPIPGPNIFLYFPFLRMLSHYRALRGIRSGLGAAAIEFKCLPDLIGLEQNLQTPRMDRRAVLAVAGGLNIRGLEQFLERMV